MLCFFFLEIVETSSPRIHFVLLIKAYNKFFVVS